jgi:hypothetical protein
MFVSVVIPLRIISIVIPPALIGAPNRLNNREFPTTKAGKQSKKQPILLLHVGPADRMEPAEDAQETCDCGIANTKKWIELTYVKMRSLTSFIRRPDAGASRGASRGQLSYLNPLIFVRLVSQPAAVFEEIAEKAPSPGAVFFGTSLWLGVAPPAFAFLGASRFGLNVGVVEPIFLSMQALVSISLAYFAALLCGFGSAALVSQWMSPTYGAQRSLGAHLALITVAGAPLALGSVAHLYPHVMINIVVLVPMLIWSLYLLYWGLPIALKTNRERGMLMASSLVAFLFVAAVSLLGTTVVLWTYGIGPRIWI